MYIRKVCHKIDNTGELRRVSGSCPLARGYGKPETFSNLKLSVFSRLPTKIKTFVLLGIAHAVEKLHVVDMQAKGSKYINRRLCT